jgi:UrcA family protein
MIRISIIAGQLLVLATAPLTAQEPVTVPDQPVVQEKVSFADLDLRNSQAQRQLESRVRHASHRVCRQSEGTFADLGVPRIARYDPTFICPDLTYNEARPKIHAAFDRAKAGQPTMAANLVVSAPRAR